MIDMANIQQTWADQEANFFLHAAMAQHTAANPLVSKVRLY